MISLFNQPNAMLDELITKRDLNAAAYRRGDITFAMYIITKQILDRKIQKLLNEEQWEK